MDEAKQRFVLAWLAKADDDLRADRLLILEENAIYAAGVYYCQQAAEKAIKAWLTYHDILFPKTLCNQRH
jgi:HEPN domain-containing protein